MRDNLAYDLKAMCSSGLYTDKAVEARTGVPRSTVALFRKRHHIPPRESSADENICFLCSKACGGCSWSGDFVPVKDWVAEPVYKDGALYTYHILACKEYENCR